jgi:hypothetical protein
MHKPNERSISSKRLRLGNALAALLVFSAAGACAQEAASYTAAITPVYQFDSDLDSGGNAGYAAVFTSIRGNWTLDSHSSLGVGLRFDYEDWRFNGVSPLGGIQPWDQLYRTGISIPYSYTTDGGWRWTFSPTVEYSGESGASVSDSVEYGALVSAARRFHTGLTLGLGVGVYDRIEETRAFPFLIVDWRISDRLRLTNPLSTGPAGPAGLEISYTLGSGWEAGIAAAYRSFRFRLDENGAIPNGIGENQNVPLVGRIGRKISDTLSFNFFVGATLAGNLRAEDQNGNRLYDVDRDPAALIGLSLAARF